MWTLFIRAVRSLIPCENLFHAGSVCVKVHGLVQGHIEVTFLKLMLPAATACHNRKYSESKKQKIYLKIGLLKLSQ